jgi:hypothetical protein
MYCERSIGDQVSRICGARFCPVLHHNMFFDFVGHSWLDVPDVIRGHFNQLGGFADRASVYTNRYPIGF